MCDILLQQWFLMKYFISYIVFGHLHLIIYTENKQKRITWILIKESIIPHNLSVEKKPSENKFARCQRKHRLLYKKIKLW